MKTIEIEKVKNKKENKSIIDKIKGFIFNNQE